MTGCRSSEPEWNDLSSSSWLVLYLVLCTLLTLQHYDSNVYIQHALRVKAQRDNIFSENWLPKWRLQTRRIDKPQYKLQLNGSEMIEMRLEMDWGWSWMNAAAIPQLLQWDFSLNLDWTLTLNERFEQFSKTLAGAEDEDANNKKNYNKRG